MKDLFTLQDDQDGDLTATSNIFSQLSEAVNVDVVNSNQGKEGSVSSSKAQESTTQNDSNIDEETNILKSLFDAHGIHSAMNHDAIISANDDVKMKMEEQASLVAQRAAQALRESRMLRSCESFAVPTWTGRSGAAGAPSSIRNKFGSTLNTQLLSPAKPTEGSSSRPPGFSVGASSGKALSSAELLSKIRGTQERAVVNALEQDLNLASTSGHQRRLQESSCSTNTPSKLMIAQPEVLIRQLCTFMQQRGGCTDSASITQHFKDRIQSKDLPLFKNLLKEIATLEKDASGSRWVLKPEFR